MSHGTIKVLVYNSLYYNRDIISIIHFKKAKISHYIKSNMSQSRNDNVRYIYIYIIYILYIYIYIYLYIYIHIYIYIYQNNQNIPT